MKKIFGDKNRRCEHALGAIVLLGTVLALTCMVGCERDADSTVTAGPEPEPLTLNPGSATLSATQTVAVLTASGGTRPYSWRVSDASLGSVPDTDVATITYTRTTALGAQVIQVQDRNQWMAESVIRQE